MINKNSARSLVLEEVKSDGMRLKCANKEFMDDREIVWNAVFGDYRAYAFASERLKRDVAIVSAALQNNGRALKLLPVELLEDEELLLKALETGSGVAFEFVPRRLKKNRDFVIKAVKTNGLVFKLLPSEFVHDREVVLAAVESEPTALEYLSDELRDDEQVVLCAVEKSGYALKHASLRLRNMPTVALAAMRSGFSDPRGIGAELLKRLGIEYHGDLKRINRKIYGLLEELVKTEEAFRQKEEISQSLGFGGLAVSQGGSKLKL